jgi:hypothetical protein
MPLNLLKVQKLLYSAGFLIDTYFTAGKICKFVRATSIVTGDSIVIYIASSYDFVIDENGDNVFALKLIDFENGDSIAQQYGDNPTGKDLTDMYGQSISIKDKSNEDHLEAEMENNYKKKIDLNCMLKDEIITVKDCCRQLKRLALSMTGIRYRLSIMKSKYFWVVNEDIVDCYYVRKFNTDGRCFFVVADLEYFYEKIQSINTDIDIIKSSIYNVLDKNNKSNVEILSKIVKKLNSSSTGDVKVTKQKTECAQQLQRHRIRLEEYSKREKVIKDMLGSLKNDGGFFNDSAYINKKAALESEIDDINSDRQKIIKLVIQLRQKYDTLYLTSDKIDFDNCILVNTIAQNLNDIEELSKVK